MCIFGRSNLCCCCCCCWPNNWEIQKRKERKRTPNKQQTDVCVSLSLEFLCCCWCSDGMPVTSAHFSTGHSIPAQVHCCMLLHCLPEKKGTTQESNIIIKQTPLLSSRDIRRLSSLNPLSISSLRWANFSFVVYLLLRIASAAVEYRMKRSTWMTRECCRHDQFHSTCLFFFSCISFYGDLVNSNQKKGGILKISLTLKITSSFLIIQTTRIQK